jgi:hypothetical protein
MRCGKIFLSFFSKADVAVVRAWAVCVRVPAQAWTKSPLHSGESRSCSSGRLWAQVSTQQEINLKVVEPITTVQMARRRYPQEAYPGMPTNDPAPSLGGSFPPLGGPGYGGSGGGGVDQSGLGAGPVAPAPVPLYQVPAPLASTTAASPLSGAPVATTGVASPWGVPAYPVGQQPSGGGGVASPFAAGGPLVGAPPPHDGGGFSPSPPTAGPGSTGVVGGAGPAYPSLETPSLYSAYPETATLGFYGGSGGAPPPSGPPAGGPPLQPTGHPTTAGVYLFFILFLSHPSHFAFISPV